MSLQITISPVGGGSDVTIADTPDPMQIQGQNVVWDGAKQLENVYGSAQAFLAYRGNDHFRETFTVLRNTDDAGDPFDDGDAAAIWFREHLQSLPREGDVSFVFDATTLVIPGAILLPVALIRQRGILLSLQYTIEGTSIS